MSLIGNLFKNKATSKENELVILVTPQILDSNEDENKTFEYEAETDEIKEFLIDKN